MRDRKEDIPALVAHQIQALNQRLGYAFEGLTGEALDHLLSYDWPGNIRELRNVLESIAVSCADGPAGVEHLPEYLRRRIAARDGGRPQDEKELLLRALAETSWNKSRAAGKLRWSRMTLYRKLEKYRIPDQRRGQASAG